ncbi:atp4 subunit B of the stator stalk of mitochondrial F1F0 ATP synthase [Savitreella phatthalungensis]
MNALRLARPALARSTVAAAARQNIQAATLLVRHNSSSSRVDPEKKAASLIDALPGNSIVSKTGTLAVGAALTAAAVSQEIYVVNEETTVLAAFIGIVTVIVRAGGGPFNEWAEGNIQRMKDLLNGARSEHTQAVRERIDTVQQMRDVVPLTKSLFGLARETVELESKAHELQQRVNFAAEAKQVLDSWVRYESSVRQREQKELAESVIAKIQREVQNPKTQQQILQQSIAEVERLISKA